MAEALFPTESGGGNHRPEAGATGLMTPQALAAAWAGTKFACTGQHIRNLVNKRGLPCVREAAPNGKLKMLLDKAQAEKWRIENELRGFHGGRREGAGRKRSGRPLGRKSRRMRSAADAAVEEMVAVTGQRPAPRDPPTASTATPTDGDDVPLGEIGGTLRRRLHEAKVAKEELEVEAKRFAMERDRGLWLQRAEARAAWSRTLSALREALDGLADRMATVAVTDAGLDTRQADAVRTLVGRELAAILKRVSEDPLGDEEKAAA